MENHKDHLKNLELVKKAMHCPLPNEARERLHLTVAQFCKLCSINLTTYWAWVSGEKEMSINQRIFLKEILRIAKEKGFI